MAKTLDPFDTATEKKPQLFLVQDGPSALKGFPSYKEALEFAKKHVSESGTNNVVTISLRCATVSKTIQFTVSEYEVY